MNKIYSLKYSAATGGLIAVSELAKRVSGKTSRILVSSLLLSIVTVTANTAYSANMYIDKVWAKDYLDLAQNKGKFKSNTTDATIELKDGSQFIFPVSIPDFSATSGNGAATAIGNAYSVTATHNNKNPSSAGTQIYGQTTYKEINRYSNNNDFQIQRLDKFVVETIGAYNSVDYSLTKDEAIERYGIDTPNGKKIIGFRAGAGVTTFLTSTGNKISTSKTYTPELLSASLFYVTNWNDDNKVIYQNDKTFRNLEINGDSGSGAYVYDNKLKQWVLLGTTHGIVTVNGLDNQTTYISSYDRKTEQTLKDIFTQNINLQNGTINIKDSDGNFELNGKQGKTEFAYKQSQKKDLYFTGGGNIILSTNFDLNSGGLIFDENQKYTVSSEGDNDLTFKGAGIDIGKGSTVDWNIKYASNDALHKIGEGTLNVTQAQNTDLKTGNGTVILGAKKTFNKIYVAGGPGTVQLNADNALPEDDYAGIFFTENGGKLDLNGHNQTFKKIAATDSGTTITNSNTTKESVLSVNNQDNYIYHGNVDGNVRLEHHLDTKQDNARLILDGDIQANTISIKNAPLVMQGHATDHAIFREGGVVCHWGFLCEADYAALIKSQEADANTKNNTAYKSNNQVSDLSQPDWETRKFRFKNLSLDNSTFSIGRNADVEGNIQAKNSVINIGDKTAYIDLHSGKNITGTGFTFRQEVKSGDSIGESKFTGGITATDGSINIGNKATVTLNTVSSLDRTPLTIHKGAKVTASSTLFTTSDIKSGGELTLTGNTVNGKVIAPSMFYAAGGYELTEDDASFTAKNQASVTGDIKSEQAAKLSFGSADEDNSVTSYSQFALAILDGFDTSYQGSINATQSSLAMNNALWKVTGNSVLKSLNSTGSMVLFNGGKNTFNTLTVDELKTSNSAFVMRTNSQESDKLVVNKSLSGNNNLLLVDFIEKKGSDNNLKIDLVSAPKGTSGDVFKTETQTVGFSDVSPVIEQKNDNDKATWTLTGYKTVANTDAAKKATSLMSGGYKAFLAEVNNLNKRMGDLRDINGEAGAWTRIMSGTGSAGGGFSDNYTHVQVGADKKHELDGLDLFTGVTMTYTDSHAGSDAFSGETKSVGAGLYASAMFESGAYIDLIGKYVHHDNEYTATFAGLGTRNYSSHSWYAGAEVGYRYHVTDSAWIEPQAELVYGAVSGKQFSWKDQGMNLTMKDKDFNPLIGRTGVDVGKSFSGKDWKVTARAGLGYQFDLFANGETVLRDASGEKRIKGEKDGRMLMNVGLNAEIHDNLRFGLEFEKSAFGKYNVDNAVNANFRYSF
ncbi:autotransporter outer membrane beta-barrel domain-containing protein [Escherichia coli]|uniref:Serine protease (Plasmid-encoded toxin Pet) n=1 Tax=Escherichia coli TaxID=562 RepID=A0A376M4F1_ECOLX|nr:autotransporter outer membrane beta-barrel domain-containing protein [Escherichia coli]STF92312.1 serine protease (plasmid-encoded toxin Pet) [Escherichia coli]